MKSFGLVLVVFGILALIYGGFSYSRQRTVLEIGSVKATATERKSIPLPPMAGAVALIGGIALLVTPRPRPA